MDFTLFAFLVFAAVVAIVFGRWMFRTGFIKGRFQGAHEALGEISRGVSFHYEKEGKATPERVAEAIDKMKAAVARNRGSEKWIAYRAHFWNIGNVMGDACWQEGFERGQHFDAPQKDELRIDIPVGRFLTICRLAHNGFVNMISRDGFNSFKNQEDAEEATNAIEALEFHIPKNYRDPSEPHALSFNRNTMIWNRWPKA